MPENMSEEKMKELFAVHESLNTGPKKEVLDFDLHTVIMTVGPTGSGKSHFCQNKLLPALKKQMLAIGEESVNVQYISSDEIRRTVMGRDAHKHDPRMMHASDAAFKLLHCRIGLAMRWPVNAQFIIVDTTGLSAEFRKKVADQAEKGQYKTALVVFDYEDDSEYKKYNTEPEFSDEIMNSHVGKLRRLLANESGTTNHSKVHKIKSKDWDKYSIDINELSYYAGCFLDPDKKYDVISDIHGCYLEFVDLLNIRGYVIDMKMGTISHADPKRKIILVGDLIDKGPFSEDILQMVYWNPQLFKLVLGNHENFVNKWLQGKITKGGPPQEIIDEYFDSTIKFKNNENATQMLNELVTVYARPFFRHPNFIVTHAPCRNKYLEKIDPTSRREQMKGPSLTNMRDAPIEEKVSNYEKVFSFIKDEGVRYAPYHVFGHVAINTPIRVNSKIFLDTGCVHGGKLTCADMSGEEPEYYHAPVVTDYGKNEQLIDIFTKEEDGQ